jgi:hypothetical protein
VASIGARPELDLALLRNLSIRICTLPPACASVVDLPLRTTTGIRGGLYT